METFKKPSKTAPVKYVFSLIPEKQIKLCSASRVTFRAWFYRTDPQNIGGQLWNTFGLFEKHFSKRERAKESPEIYFKSEKFQD